MFRTKKGTRRGKRKRGADKSRKRREKRKREKQQRKRAIERRKNSKIVIIIWNMCKITMREQNRERMRRVATHIQKRGWEVVLMTEITSSEEEGVIWMGEAANLTVIIHSRHSAILLRERALNEWLKGGEKSG